MILLGLTFKPEECYQLVTEVHPRNYVYKLQQSAAILQKKYYGFNGDFISFLRAKIETAKTPYDQIMILATYQYLIITDKYSSIKEIQYEIEHYESQLKILSSDGGTNFDGLIRYYRDRLGNSEKKLERIIKNLSFKGEIISPDKFRKKH